MTLKDTETLEAIYKLTQEMGVPPTTREIQAELGVSSLNTVWYRLERLRKRGLIHESDGRARGTCVLTTEGLAAVDAPRDPDIVVMLWDSGKKGVRVRIYDDQGNEIFEKKYGGATRQAKKYFMARMVAAVNGFFSGKAYKEAHLP